MLLDFQLLLSLVCCFIFTQPFAFWKLCVVITNAFARWVDFSRIFNLKTKRFGNITSNKLTAFAHSKFLNTNLSHRIVEMRKSLR